MPANRARLSRRRSALLAVLWLVAALSAIAFSVANTSEERRAATNGRGSRPPPGRATERAILYMPGRRAPPGRIAPGRGASWLTQVSCDAE
jgi:hypothetical protein